MRECYHGPMIDKLKKVTVILISVFLYLLAGMIIYFFWQPIVSWYYNYRPILGVDFYNTASYVGYLFRHFAFRFNGWKYIWHGGYPLQLDYPSFHAYLNLPLLFLTNLSLPQAVQVYMLASCFLFLFFAYLLLVELGRDRILALVLVVAMAFSIGLYGPLVWGGSLPYFASQFFLPLCLWLLVKFFNANSSAGQSAENLRSGIIRGKEWYYLSSFFLGVSFLGHPQMAFSYAGPMIALVLLFYPLGDKLFSRVRFKRLLLYFLLAVIIGYPQLGIYLGRTPGMILSFPKRMADFFGEIVKGNKLMREGGPSINELPQADTGAIAEFHRNQLKHFLTDTHPLLLVFLAAAGLVILLTLFLRIRRKKSWRFLVFFLPAIWILAYNSLYAFQMGFFHGGWYRVFWAFPLSLGMIIGFAWGDFWQAVRGLFPKISRQFVFNLIIVIVSGVIILGPSVFLFQSYPAARMLSEIETPGLRQQSSAFPDAINVEIDGAEVANLQKKLVPAWLDPNQTNYRLAEADQRVNIWWNAFFDLPLAKGYIDPPEAKAAGGLYWLSIALFQTGGIDSLVESWKVPPQVAYNNALFLIDWLSIKYLEADHEKSDTYSPLTSYLEGSEIFARKERIEVPGWAELYPKGQSRIAWHPEVAEHLTYYEVKENSVSPIVHATTASTLGVIGKDDAYQTIVRDLAAINLNSRSLIPIQLGQFIDQVDDRTLADMDLVILYGYNYRRYGKTWAKLEDYVRQGGKLFIETGSEVKETDSTKQAAQNQQILPAIFPVNMTEKADIGRQWQFSSQGEETQGVDLGSFGPPLLDGQPWLFSRPVSETDLRPGARVVLAHQGIPLIVGWNFGQGQVFWSGMNLPYHLTVYNNLEEAKLLKNLFGRLVSLSPVTYPPVKIDRKSAEKVLVKAQNARGLFFREQDYPGWRAKIKSSAVSQNLRIYRGGPVAPGFMYVSIPKAARSQTVEVTFTFRGDFWGYFWAAISVFTGLVLIDRSIFQARLLIPVVKKVTGLGKIKIGRWWDREEEY